MSHVLVVDDEPAIGWTLREMLTDEGHDVDLAANVNDAVAAAARARPDAILLDVRLPGRDGIEAIPDLRVVAAAAPIVVMTAFGDLDTAVRAVRAGAFDYLVKPFDLEHVSAVVARAVADGTAAGDDAESAAAPRLVGSSPAMQAVFRQIARVAADDRPVLVTGPAGSGKQLAARSIHGHGSRRSGPLVVTSLAALAPTAIAGELFGVGDEPGLLARAGGGTLVVEEIDLAPPAVQARLARVIADPRWAAARPAGARLVATTCRRPDDPALHAELVALVGPLVIDMPPLAERSGDVEALVGVFLTAHAAVTRRPVAVVTAGFLAAVRSRTWPGNVRDLKAAVEHAAVVARGMPLSPAHLPVAEAAGEAPVETAASLVAAAVREWAAAARGAFGTLPEPDLHHRTIRLVELTLLREVLAHAGGNRTAAAKLLGLDRATLRTKLRQLGLDD